MHPGTADVSADLLELARTPILLVCSGPKSIVDPVSTAERFEELGIGVVGYRCDRMPFFLVREADVELDRRVDDAGAAAEIVRAIGRMAAAVRRPALQPGSGIRRDGRRDRRRRDPRTASGSAATEGVRGGAVTPFLLSCLAERTEGASLEANLTLLEANARLAGEVAFAAAGPARDGPGAT